MTRKEAELEAQLRWGNTGDVVHLAQQIYQVGLWSKNQEGHMAFVARGRGSSWVAAFADANSRTT